MTLDAGYYEVSVVYDGFLDSEDIIEPSDIDNWIKSVTDTFSNSLAIVEAYAIFHPHPLISCECAQYLTDHHPIWTNHKEA